MDGDAAMKTFLSQAVALSLLRLMMDLLLPENDLKRYADLGAGLCMMLCMLSSLHNALRFIEP